MTTVLHARPTQFIQTPSVQRLAVRALRYLQSGYSIHLQGPAGSGKTTMAMHLASLMARPMMLIFGDDELNSGDMVGNQSGFSRKKVVDNYIHSVYKLEDEFRQVWVDSRLTLACQEGFTLIYDEFNRSRPEVNNVLLSALEEKLLILPPSANRVEYVRVNPNFRAIFTSNPAEYAGVHDTQDALLDRLVTIVLPEPDAETQQQILVQKIGLGAIDALTIVSLVHQFRKQACPPKSSGLRAAMMIGRICHEHDIPVVAQHPDFADVCADVLLSRATLAYDEAVVLLRQLLGAVRSAA